MLQKRTSQAGFEVLKADFIEAVRSRLRTQFQGRRKAKTKELWTQTELPWVPTGRDAWMWWDSKGYSGFPMTESPEIRAFPPTLFTEWSKTKAWISADIIEQWIKSFLLEEQFENPYLVDQNTQTFHCGSTLCRVQRVFLPHHPFRLSSVLNFNLFMYFLKILKRFVNDRIQTLILGKSVNEGKVWIPVECYTPKLL